MKTKYWFAFILLATMLAACSDSQTVTTSTATNAPATVSPTLTSLPPTATLAPTATAIPLVWRQISAGQEFTRDKIIALVTDLKDFDVLYVKMENAGYYQSTDGGISWQPIQLKENELNSIVDGMIDNRNRNIFSNIAADGIMRSYQYGGWEKNTSSRWFVSEDGGATWRGFSEAGTYGSNAIAFDSAGAVYVFCGNNICKFSADAKQLTVLGKPKIGVDSIIAISPQSSNTIYAAGDGLSVSRDGGYTWVSLNNGLGNNKLLLEAGTEKTNSRYLLLGDCNRNRERSTMEQSIYRSVDGGSTWEFLDKRGCFLIMDADGQTAYRLATDSDNFGPWIWRSSNNGRRWDKIRIPSVITTLVTHPSRSGVLYAYNDKDPLNKYVSEDYGDSWNRDSSTAVKPCYGSTLYFLDSYKPISIDPRDGNHVFFIASGMLFESRDSCNTSKVFATVQNISMNSIAFDPNKPDTLYAGTDEGAYISFDSGESWNQINDGLLNSLVVYSIAVDKDGNVYASTPYGIYQLDSK